MRKLLTTLFLVFATTVVYAHVGSADVYYEGDAGPYHLFVTVRLPQVIPGVSQIEVRSASPDVQTIHVVILRLTGPGSDLPSTPDLAQRSKYDPQFFVSNLWFMEYGALKVSITAEGSKGRAELSVPVASFPRQPFPMSRWLQGLGAFVLMFLTLSIVPIVGGVVLKISVPPGEAPQASNERRSRTAMVGVLIVTFVLLYWARTWWNTAAATYERSVNLLEPPRAETTLLEGNRLAIRTAGKLMIPFAGSGNLTQEVKMDDLMPDHGHLMHLFLIGEPGMDRMWHLHPTRASDGTFTRKLPTMPAGKYQIFADIVDKNGFPWTLVGNLDVPQIKGTALICDDSGWQGVRLTTPVSQTTVAPLLDGARIVWDRGDLPLQANVPIQFKFRVEEKDGSLARGLEPYMGMAAHAQVVCSDLSVFAHIHPSGTVSMAALDMAQTGSITHSSDDMPGMAMDMPGSSALQPPTFSFPYGLPHPGNYRIFVQIKRSGQVQTAAFDVNVQ